MRLFHFHIPIVVRKKEKLQNSVHNHVNNYYEDSLKMLLKAVEQFQPKSSPEWKCRDRLLEKTGTQLSLLVIKKKLSSVVLTTSANWVKLDDPSTLIFMALNTICRALNTIWWDIAPQTPHCPHYHSPTAMSRLHSSAMNPKLLLNVNTRCSSQITDRIVLLLVSHAHLGNLKASQHLLVGECLHEHQVHVYALTPVMTAWQIILKIDTILPTALNTPKTSSISSRISKS